jgi:membrane fusion protein, multidrug efflux system
MSFLRKSLARDHKQGQKRSINVDSSSKKERMAHVVPSKVAEWLHLTHCIFRQLVGCYLGTKQMLLFMVLLSLHLTACKKSSEAAQTKPKAAGRPPAPVKVTKVEQSSLTDEWVYRGDVRSMQEAKLAAGAEGIVRKTEGREGDWIKKGQLLVVLDTSLVRPQLAKAKAQRSDIRVQIAQAKRDLKRAEQLKGSVTTPAELEAIQTRIESLQAQQKALSATMSESSARLARHRLHAPFDGVIRKRSVNLGDWVSVGQSLYDLVDPRQVEILVAAPKELLPYIKLGTIASVGQSTTLKLKVTGIVPALDPSTRTTTIRLQPQSTGKDPVNNQLLPGSVVQVGFHVTYNEQGLLVPRDALVPSPFVTKVIKVVDNKAKPITVEVIASTALGVLVKSKELKAGDTVVIRGNERLGPDNPLKILEN